MSESAPTIPAPPEGAGPWPVLGVALRRMLLSRRTLLLLLLALLPAGLTLLTVAVAALVRGGDTPAVAELLGTQSDFFLRVLLPLAALLYGGAVIADEVDAGTLVYLWARPVSRRNLVAGRTLAAALAAALVTCLGVLCLGLTALGAGMRMSLFAKLPLALATVFVTAPAFAALFAAFGSWFRRPLVMGLLWILVWETLVGLLPGAIRYLTLTQHARSLFPYVTENSGWFVLPFEPTTAPVAVAVLLGVAAAATAAHVLWLGHFELRLTGGED